MNTPFKINDWVLCKKELFIESDLHTDLNFTFRVGMEYQIVDLIHSINGKTITFVMDEEREIKFSSKMCKRMPKFSD